MKTCSYCGAEKPESEFVPKSRQCKACRKTSNRAYYLANRDAIREQQHGYHERNALVIRKRARDWATANPERVKENQLRWTYNLTPEQLKAFGDQCGICGSKEDLHIDHDHSCCPPKGRSCGKCVRGLLCASHNKALGFFADSITDLLAAVEYLASFRLP